MCGYVGLKNGGAWGRGEVGGLWETGQLMFNMGPNFEVLTLH
jgi:hypothetical protein